MSREWKNAPLGELCTVCAGGTPSRAKPEYWGGDLPWVKISDMLQGTITATDECITRVGLENSAAKLLPPGTLLLSIFATIGRTAVLGIEAATNQAIVGLTVRDSNKLNLDFLRRFLELKTVELEGRARGVAQANINGAILKALSIPLPPLAEQRRIAEVLDRAEALRAKRHAAIAQLDSLTQSLFLDLFGDPATNPKGFPKKPLASLVRDDDTINYGVVQPGDDLDEGIPLVRVGDLLEGRVSHASLKRIAPSIEAAYKRSRLRGDEILVSCVGSIGVVVLADESVKGFNIARAVARIPLAETTNRIFLAAFLNTDFVQRYFTNELRTVSQPTLNIKQLSETTVVLPPISLQREFARRVTAVEQLKTAHRASLAELDALFATLQHRAFRGEL